MKPKITLVLVLLLFAFSCKKNSGYGALLGKWRSTELYFAPDGKGIYMPESANSGTQYVQFSWPGSVQSTFFTNCISYNVKGNELTLKFTNNTNPNQVVYTYTIVNDTLKLYPVTGCSGCSFPFVKE